MFCRTKVLLQSLNTSYSRLASSFAGYLEAAVRVEAALREFYIACLIAIKLKMRFSYLIL